MYGGGRVGGETVDGKSQLDAEQRDQHERGSGSLSGHSGDRMNQYR